MTKSKNKLIVADELSEGLMTQNALSSATAIF
jgi:hypothetical protein